LLVNILGKHRSRIRILAKILSVVNQNNGAKKTRIMYDAYLSYELLTRYLTDLVNANLIIYKKDNTYILTSVGEQFLSKFAEYSKLDQDIKEKVNHIKKQKLILEKICPTSNLSNIDNRSLKTTMNIK